jgi:hypothetical protein
MKIHKNSQDICDDLHALLGKREKTKSSELSSTKGKKTSSSSTGEFYLYDGKIKTNIR